jgi:hypothetical protein
MTNDQRNADDADVPAPNAKLEGDERMYTGEPVDTEDGLRRPQQMNVGRENMEGGGEWPDPNTPPRSGSAGAADTPADDTDER